MILKIVVEMSNYTSDLMSHLVLFLKSTLSKRLSQHHDESFILSAGMKLSNKYKKKKQYAYLAKKLDSTFKKNMTEKLSV